MVIRRWLASVTVAWLLVHVAVLASVSVIPAFGGAAMLADLACTCSHGAAGHEQCPMHHKDTDTARCRMQGSHQDANLTLVFALGQTGILPLAGHPLVNDVSAATPVHETVAPLSLLPSPGAPPPRV